MICTWSYFANLCGVFRRELERESRKDRRRVRLWEVLRSIDHLPFETDRQGAGRHGAALLARGLSALVPIPNPSDDLSQGVRSDGSLSLRAKSHPIRKWRICARPSTALPKRKCVKPSRTKRTHTLANLYNTKSSFFSFPCTNSNMWLFTQRICLATLDMFRKSA
jgi:hypothetical protein